LPDLKQRTLGVVALVLRILDPEIGAFTAASVIALLDSARIGDDPFQKTLLAAFCAVGLGCREVGDSQDLADASRARRFGIVQADSIDELPEQVAGRFGDHRSIEHRRCAVLRFSYWSGLDVGFVAWRDAWRRIEIGEPLRTVAAAADWAAEIGPMQCDSRLSPPKLIGIYQATVF
jgi:hypothetical protein